MLTLLLIMAAGALGVAARYGVDAWLTSRVGDDLPWSTLVVNVVGSFALGWVAYAAARSGSDLGGLHAPMTIGLLGGFTTFSSYALESVMLLVEGTVVRGVGYIVATNVASIGAAATGIVAARALR